jgi:hypothetical protein
MDVVSAASSVSAVIQITAEVFKICHDYVLAAKNARSEIGNLCNELTALDDVLGDLDSFITASATEELPTLNKVFRPNGPLDQCLLELKGLKERVNPGEGEEKMQRFGRRALSWQFSRKEVNDAVETIRRQKEAIQLSLSTDSA